MHYCPFVVTVLALLATTKCNVDQGVLTKTSTDQLEDKTKDTGEEPDGTAQNSTATAVTPPEKTNKEQAAPNKEQAAPVRWAACCYNPYNPKSAGEQPAEQEAEPTEEQKMANLLKPVVPILLTARKQKGYLTGTADCEGDHELDVDIMNDGPVEGAAPVKDEGNCSELNPKEAVDMHGVYGYLTDLIKNRATFQPPSTSVLNLLGKQRGKYKITKTKYQEALDTYRKTSSLARTVVFGVERRIKTTYCKETGHGIDGGCLTGDQSESVESCYLEQLKLDLEGVAEKVSTERSDLWNSLGGQSYQEATESELHEKTEDTRNYFKEILDYFWNQTDNLDLATKCAVDQEALKYLEDKKKAKDKEKVVKNILERLKHRFGEENKSYTKGEIGTAIKNLEESTGNKFQPSLTNELTKDVKKALDSDTLEDVVDDLAEQKKDEGGDDEDDDEQGEDVKEKGDKKKNKKKNKGCRVIRAVLARTIGPNGARVKAAFHKMREKIRAMNPLRKPKVARTATASVTTPPSFAMKVNKSMSNLTNKAEHMIQRIFGRETDGGEEEGEA